MNDERYKRNSRGGRGGGSRFGSSMKNDFGGGDGMLMSNYEISRRGSNRGGDMTSPHRYMGGASSFQRSHFDDRGFNDGPKGYPSMRGGGGSRGGAYKGGRSSFRPIPGMPSPVGGPSYPSYKPNPYKPRNNYYNGNSYKSNRTQYSEQQLKERSQIKEADWNICWEFNSKRGCRRGSACKWKHGGFSAGEKQVFHPVTKEALNGAAKEFKPAGAAFTASAPSAKDPEQKPEADSDKAQKSPDQQQKQEQTVPAQEEEPKEETDQAVMAAKAASQQSASTENKSAPKAETEETNGKTAVSDGDKVSDNKAETDGQKVQPIVPAVE